MATTKITWRIEADHLAQLQVEADNDGRTLNNLISKILADYLKRATVIQSDKITITSVPSSDVVAPRPAADFIKQDDDKPISPALARTRRIKEDRYRTQLNHVVPIDVIENAILDLKRDKVILDPVVWQDLWDQYQTRHAELNF